MEGEDEVVGGGCVVFVLSAVGEEGVEVELFRRKERTSRVTKIGQALNAVEGLFSFPIVLSRQNRPGPGGQYPTNAVSRISPRAQCLRAEKEMQCVLLLRYRRVTSEMLDYALFSCN